MSRLSGLVAVVMLAASCQSYDFERVVPVTLGQTNQPEVVASRRLKPNVMLLVDNSTSMYLPTNPSDAACPLDCGTPARLCPAQCPTRVSELKSAMGTFLSRSSTVARLGLTIFPTSGGSVNGVPGCDPASSIAQPFPAPTATDDNTDAALDAVAQAINTRLQALTPSGGTPTGASLEFVGTTEGLNASDFRDDFVLLLTDGLPNCNGTNANNVCACSGSCSTAQLSACNCKTGSCSGTDPVRSACSKGCLDGDATVERVKALRQRGIRTIVVGFGADLASGDGPAVLNAMAREGDFARACKDGTDAECGGQPGSCDLATRKCTTAFYQAANGTELAVALEKISKVIDDRDPCVHELAARPSEARFIAVLIDDRSVAPGPETYSYDFTANRVTFQGALCTQLRNSTPQNPVNVLFHIVERL